MMVSLESVPSTVSIVWMNRIDMIDWGGESVNEFQSSGLIICVDAIAIH